MASPSFSVIVPAFNAADTIARALDSAAASIAQARRHLDCAAEIIVVDDASEDDTLQVSARFRAPRTSVVLKRNPENRGPAFARNEGARLSRADFLFFLDADDRYLPGHIGLCLAELAETSGLGYVQTGIELPDFLHPSWILPTLDSHTINKCVRRSSHLMIGGFPEEPVFRRAAEDLFYSLLLKRYLKGSKIARKTVVHELHPGNQMDRHREWLSQPFDKTRNGFTPEQQQAANETMRRRVAWIAANTAPMRRARQPAGGMSS